MNFLLADTFTDSLARLTGGERKVVSREGQASAADWHSRCPCGGGRSLVRW